MSYCTLADLIEQYSEQKIREVSDRVNKPATTIDTVIVDRAIADADSEIDLHLHGRYQLPLASVPTALKRIACGLAYANLHIVLKEENPVYKTAEHLRKLLSGIANGKLSLALDADGKPAPVANTVQISEGRNDWGPTGERPVRLPVPGTVADRAYPLRGFGSGHRFRGARSGDLE
ncbi:gp436 family protein [Pseudomonas aeruginosa]